MYWFPNFVGSNYETKSDRNQESISFINLPYLVLQYSKNSLFIPKHFIFEDPGRCSNHELFKLSKT